MRSLRLRVQTPERSVFDSTVDTVIAPLPDGWIGVLPGHTPFQARLLRGEIALRIGGKRHRIATQGGLLNVDADVVNVLTGAAAVDVDLPTLEQQVGDAVRQARSMEQEAEKHFGRVYRALADTLDQRRQRRK